MGEDRETSQRAPSDAKGASPRSGRSENQSLTVPLLVLGAVPFVMVLGNSMLIPLFPKMESAMHLTSFQVGLLVSAFSIPAGIVIPCAGAISDYIGRRAIMTPALVLYGLGGFVAGGAAMLTAHPYGWILAGRILQGIGAGGTYQLAMALVGDLLAGGERTQALAGLEAANGLGKVVSPVVGSLVALIVWYAAFFTYGVLALPVAAAVWFLVKEGKRPKQSAKQYIRGLKAIFSSQGVELVASYLVGTMALFLLFGLLSYVSDDLKARFGITGLVKGLAVAVPVAASSLMAFLIGTLLQAKAKWAKPAMLVGNAALVVALALVPFAMRGNLWIYLPATAFVGLGIGTLLPPLNTLITGSVNRDERGVIVGLYGSVRFFGVAAGPPLFALVAPRGRLLLFLSAAALAVVVFFAASAFVRPDKMKPGKEGGGRNGGDPPARTYREKRTGDVVEPERDHQPTPEEQDHRVPEPV